MILTFDLWPWNSVRFVRLSRYMFMQNIIKLSAAVHEYIVYTNFIALSRSGKESKNPVLWPRPLTYDLEVPWVSSGCQDTRCCKISSSCVQRFMSYRGHSARKKNSDENNTVGRYRADSNKILDNTRGDLRVVGVLGWCCCWCCSVTVDSRWLHAYKRQTRPRTVQCSTASQHHLNNVTSASTISRHRNLLTTTTTLDNYNITTTTAQTSNFGTYFIIACICVNGCYCYIFLLVVYILILLPYTV